MSMKHNQHNRCQLGYKDAKAFAEHCIIRDTPVMLTGPSGSGKTVMAEDIARDGNMLIVCISASSIEPTEFVGIPSKVIRNGVELGRTQLNPSIHIPLVQDMDQITAQQQRGDFKHILVFIDEVQAAAPAVQRSLYTFVQERRVGHIHLHPDVRIIMARNTSEDGGNDEDLPDPFKNRFAHIYVKPTTDDWLEYAQREHFSPTIRAFMAAKPESLNTYAEASGKTDMELYPAFSTSRSWAQASKLLDHEIIDPSNPIHQHAIFSSVGSVEAAGIMAFSKSPVPSVKTMLDDIGNGTFNKGTITNLTVDSLWFLTALIGSFAEEDTISGLITILECIPRREIKTLGFKSLVDSQEITIQMLDDNLDSRKFLDENLNMLGHLFNGT